MSTDFYRVCQDCLDRVKHYHAEQPPIVHRWFGGEEKGTQLQFPAGMPDNTILIDRETGAEGHLISFEKLKKEIGAGRKR